MGSTRRLVITIGIAGPVLGGAAVAGLMQLFGPSKDASASRRAAPSPPGLPGSAAAPTAVAPAAPAPTAETPAGLEALLRAAVTAPSPDPSSSASSDSAPPREDEAALSPDAMRAYERARTLVDQGVANGTWTQDDRQELRGDLLMLSTERRIELERPLIVAVNEGRVHFRGHGPLF